MTAALPLLDAMIPPPIRRPVDVDGQVIPIDQIDEVLSWEGTGFWNRARIELHVDRTSGLFMWASSFGAHERGSGYRVGPKWGKFAPTRESALHWAVAEIKERMGEPRAACDRKIVAWLDGLS